MSTVGKRRGPFDLSLDPRRVPGYRSRFARIGEVAPQLHELSKSMKANDDVGHAENLREKFVTGSDKRTLPSQILRRRGFKV